VGSVFQSPEHQFVRSTAQSEVALGLRITGARSTNVDRLTRVALERMGLGDLSTAHPFTLSGGEKRRLAVAAATVTRPRLVVVDEPTFGQDDDSWREVVDLLDELAAAGSAVVITTHDSDLLALVDEVVDFPKPGQS
jgi:energy-coupling factor transport system ATP-binding protein